MARAEPDRAALEVALRMLDVQVPLDSLLADPACKVILHTLARRHMRRRAEFDVKKLQANDND